MPRDRRISRSSKQRRALKTEAVRSSGTSINFYQTTRRNIPEDGTLRSCHCENFKSHFVLRIFAKSGPSFPPT
jgi:hypothetical protein